MAHRVGEHDKSWESILLICLDTFMLVGVMGITLGVVFVVIHTELPSKPSGLGPALGWGGGEELLPVDHVDYLRLVYQLEVPPVEVFWTTRARLNEILRQGTNVVPGVTVEWNRQGREDQNSLIVISNGAPGDVTRIQRLMYQPAVSRSDTRPLRIDVDPPSEPRGIRIWCTPASSQYDFWNSFRATCER